MKFILFICSFNNIQPSTWHPVEHIFTAEGPWFCRWSSSYFINSWPLFKRTLAVLISAASGLRLLESAEGHEQSQCLSKQLPEKVLQHLLCWPKKTSSDNLYEQTGGKKLSSDIKKRWIRWLGHVLRMTSARNPKTALIQSLAQKRQSADLKGG